MKTISTILFLALITFSSISQTIWTGPKTTFTKADGADWNLQANQDRLTNNVWITRANNSGLFNIVSETSHTKNVSPADTEWAYGTTADIASLNFQPWGATNGSNPPSMVGQDMVLHLISDDIYIDLKFLSWSSGGAGGQGGFSYERSTDQTTGIKNLGNDKKIAIYPNPSSKFVVLKGITVGTNAEIYDLSGKRVSQVRISENDQIDISWLDNGIYMLIIPDYGYSKFIKE
jgi:hypothetical protein